MYDYFFTFRSVTAALNGKRVLQELGIRSKVMRTPGELQSNGCGYCLMLSEELAVKAQSVFQMENIRYIKGYRREEKGRWQEVQR